MSVQKAPEPAASLRCLGAAGTVTGSKYLIRAGRHRLLLECGLFQGLKSLRLRNWEALPVDPRRLDAVVLSHAHIDHSGYLPRLVQAGFRGQVFCTAGTADLLRIMLPDAAMLQEEEAKYANREGYSKHRPALPLYTLKDAKAALRLLQPCGYGRPIEVAPEIATLFRRAGHILGSATVELRLGASRLVFSGDLGRGNQPMLRDPEPVRQADVLLLESTYGDQTHPGDPMPALERIVHEAIARGGVLLVPAFAVGRAQLLIWMLRQLEDAGRIPSLPVYLDSPMAIDVSTIFCKHPEDHSLDMTALMDVGRCPLCCRQYHLVRRPEESKALNQLRGPAIIIAGSGMATGGRILHHLKLRLPDPRTTVLLTGYQAAGTRGRRLLEGQPAVRIHGRDVPVRARIERLEGLSAHADQEELLRWLSGFSQPPRTTLLVHGEPGSAEALQRAIEERLRWTVRPAREGEDIVLSAAHKQKGTE